MKDYCVRCGKKITDYEDTEWKEYENTLLLTYRCSCGCYAEQVYKIEYVKTNIISVNN